MNSEVDTDFADSQKKSNSTVKVIVTILVIALVAVGCYFGYEKFFKSSPIKVYENAINNVVKKMNNRVESVASYTKNNAKFKIELEGEMGAALGLDVLKDYEFVVNQSTDKTKNIFTSELTITDTKNNQSATTTAYLSDNTLYLNFKDVYDKVIKVGNLEELNLPNVSIDVDSVKIKYLSEKLTSLYLETIKEENIKESKETVKVNGKDIELTALKYVYTQEEAVKTIKHVIEGLVNDATAVDYIASITGETKENVKEELNEISNETKPNSELTDTLDIVVYTKANKNNAVGIIVKFAETTLKYFNVDKNLEVSINTNGMEFIKLSGNLEKDGKVTLSLNMTGTPFELLTVNINDISSKKIDASYTISLPVSSNSTFSINGIVKFDITKSKNSSSLNGEFSINTEIEGSKIGLKITAEENSSNEIVNVDVDLNNAVDINSVNEEELEEKLMKKYSEFSIIKNLMSTAQTMTQAYDY